jgi:hypothetical protein
MKIYAPYETAPIRPAYVDAGEIQAPFEIVFNLHYMDEITAEEERDLYNLIGMLMAQKRIHVHEVQFPTPGYRITAGQVVPTITSMGRRPPDQSPFAPFHPNCRPSTTPLFPDSDESLNAFLPLWMNTTVRNPNPLFGITNIS